MIREESMEAACEFGDGADGDGWEVLRVGR